LSGTLSHVVSNTLSKLRIASSSQAFYVHTNLSVRFFISIVWSLIPKFLKEKTTKARILT